MSRVAGSLAVLLAVAAAAPAAGPGSPPETLLPPGTQVFVRWDGITPHADAYSASAWGGVMRGPTGDSIRALLAKAPQLLGAQLLAEPLLEGAPPAELAAVHKDFKLVTQIPQVVADRGILVAVEVQEPRLSWGGIGRAIGGLAGGDGNPAGAFTPEVQAFLIVPNAGDRADALFAPTRLFNRSSGGTAAATPLPPELKVKGYRWVSQTGPNDFVHLGEWVIDGHFVEYAGTLPVERAIARMRENAAKGGLTGHKLYQRCLQTEKTAGFESVCRGYVDTGALIGMARKYAGLVVRGLDQRLSDLGVNNLAAVAFTSGFSGKESRSVYEIDLGGERKGFAKIFKPDRLTLDDLPPLPPDCPRFSALRIDVPRVFDSLVAAAETLGMNQPFGPEDGAKSPSEAIRLRREYLVKELDKATGISVTDDLLAHLGDKVVVFHGPTEGLNVFGTVVAVSCKNPAGVRKGMDRALHAFEELAGGRLKVRKKIYAGVEMREFYGRGFGVVTPTYAVVGDWLVFAGAPQPVQGFILRTKGELPKWKPDADTAARLAKLPPDACGIQYCTPQSTVSNLCCIGPLFLSTVGRFGGNDNGDPIDVGLIPNAHELNRHLFPNLTVTRDDGKTVRIETSESFSLPLEFIGFEPFAFALMTGLFAF